MAIDLFDTRTMLAFLEQRKRPKTFLLDQFFPRMERSLTKNVDIDIFKGKRRVAPFVNPRMEGTNVTRIGFTTNSFQPPYVKPKISTEAGEFLQRLMGQHIYAPGDGPGERARKRLAEDITDLDDLITRREELMASQVLQTGIVTVDGEGVSDSIDFGIPASHIITLAGGDLWTAATSDPEQDLKDWSRIIAQDAGLTATDAILGHVAAENFFKNSEVKSKLDTRRIDLGLIRPEMIGNGATFLGRLNRAGLDLWTYDEWYIDPVAGGAEKEMIDDEKVIVLARSARMARHFGAIQDLDVEGLASVPRFPKSWRTDDPSVQWLMVQSAPLVTLHQPDAIVVADVI